MSIAYTSLLALGQPATGTESGTWGDDVNNAITSYLDIAIAGTLSFSGDGAVSLANTFGTSSATNIGASTAQYMVLRFTGTLSTTKVITAPSASKLYLVDNATSGGFGVTVKASGQTGYTVAASTKAWVYYNGTDYVLASTNDVSKMTGTLAATQGGTGQSSYAVGDILYASSTTALSKLAIAAAGNVLRSGTTPAWGKVDLSTDTSGSISLTTQVTGTLPVANGGTGQTTAAAAFDALKQSATDSYTGVVELATNAEALTGTDTTRPVTPASMRAGFSASGSAPVFACRAWVNFDGTGAAGTNMTIRGSGNVTSVYQNTTGDFTITFTTAMPDANYAVTGTVSGTTNHPQYALAVAWGTPPTTSSVRIFTGDTGGAGSVGRLAGGEYTSVAIFR
jgi:hypothetical protein